MNRVDDIHINSSESSYSLAYQQQQQLQLLLHASTYYY